MTTSWNIYHELYPEVTWTLRNVKNHYNYLRHSIAFREKMRTGFWQLPIDSRGLPSLNCENPAIVAILMIQRIQGLGNNGWDWK
jgi:hypothetical protein